ncbi:hypothetical protein BH10CYA1_BH10CYA1_53410 [soil metagenome]
MNSQTVNRQSFWVKPYVQLGNSTSTSEREIVWFSTFGKKHWTFEYRLLAAKSTLDKTAAEKSEEAESPWIRASVDKVDCFADPKGSAVKQLVAQLPHVSLNDKLEYRLRLDADEVFRTQCTYSNRVVVVGDWADGYCGAAQIAASIMPLDPGMVVIPGDVVYDNGRTSDYPEVFFPVLNADQTSSQTGAPLLRSRLFVAAVGNHDISRPDTLTESLSEGEKNDLFGFLRFWRQPKNNAIKMPRREVKKMLGKGKTVSLLWQRFGAEFIEKLNFSFDVVDDTYTCHWIVLDANKYMDWSREELRTWLRADLQAAKNALWRFVVFHQPPFNSDVKYRLEQRMRLICDILQEEMTDLGLHGHCHFYQRHDPIVFKAHTSHVSEDGTVAGDIFTDTTFDGVQNKNPSGVIYLVTGAGGKLSDKRPSSFGISSATRKLVDDRFSFTVMDFSDDGKQLTVRQMSQGPEGLEELDRFVIEK